MQGSLQQLWSGSGANMAAGRQQPMHGHNRGKAGSYPVHNYEARYKALGNTPSRLNNFTGGTFSANNLAAMMFHDRTNESQYIQMEVWNAPGLSKPTFEEAKKATDYKPAHIGDSFGPTWSNHWFKITLKIPPGWEKYERIQLEFDPSGEAMIYTTDGLPIHAITGGYGGDRRVEFILRDSDRKAGVAHYFIETSCNRLGGMDGIQPPNPNVYFPLNSADLCAPNLEAWAVMYDFECLHQLSQDLPEDSALARRAMYTANKMMNVFRENDQSSLADCRKVAEEILGEGWEQDVAHESKNASDQKGPLWGIGHCHIDSAWLWPFSVTQQKAARSWSTQVDLMDRYPEHRFSATTAQQYKWVETLYPKLFERIKEKVADGRFQPLGSTWVEMDVNMPTGESLVRQFLYGQRYYQSRFGFRSKIFVLPDTFGYSCQLPQLCRLAGVSYFFTQKMSWNLVNQFPHNSFNWIGIDGSQVLTHLTPVDNYGAQCNVSEMRKAMTNNKNSDVTNDALYLFGNGDGGGGPTPNMLEKLRRARAVTKKDDIGGLVPQLKMGGSFDEFFEQLRTSTDNGKTLPTWKSELYLEVHRGTYTSHGSIKKANRQLEILLREAEYAATMASLADSDYEYPKKTFDAAWEELLLCQFHDVLPGSSIAMVYDDAEKKYAFIRKTIGEVLENAHQILYAGSLSLDNASNVKGSVFAVNTLPNYHRREIMEVPVDAHASIKDSAVQTSRDGHTAYLLMEGGKAGTAEEMVVSPQSITDLYDNRPKVSVHTTGPDTFIMSNQSVKMTVDEGRIVSVYDVALEKELIPEGMTGGMVIMEDHPNDYDAWDVDSFHLEKQTHLKFGQVNIVEYGPVRATLGATVMYGQSRMEVEITLDAISASLKADARSMIRFNAVIDWHESHKFLKFELPLDINNDTATYDTQFGTIDRPTHKNTSWDAAKFEVCAHKFGDLSEYGYGVALINDCKYGYATDGNVMRLSLLRSPKAPDANTDMGTHRMSWAIYPHVGTYAESDVADVAYAFNQPMRLRYTSNPTASTHALAASSPFKLHGAPNVRLETIKRGEDDDFEMDGKKTIILRLFEHMGGHAKTCLKISGLTIKKAEIVNILEDSIETLPMSLQTDDDVDSDTPTSCINLSFRGYEVKSIKLTVGGEKKRRVSGSGTWVKL